MTGGIELVTSKNLQHIFMQVRSR